MTVQNGPRVWKCSPFLVSCGHLMPLCLNESRVSCAGFWERPAQPSPDQTRLLGDSPVCHVTLGGKPLLPFPSLALWKENSFLLRSHMAELWPALLEYLHWIQSQRPRGLSTARATGPLNLVWPWQGRPRESSKTPSLLDCPLQRKCQVCPLCLLAAALQGSTPVFSGP